MNINYQKICIKGESSHIQRLIDTSTRIKKNTQNEKIEIWEFQCKKDDDIRSKEAKYFRDHFCLDSNVGMHRDDTGKPRNQYLKNLKFLDETERPSPSICSGNFSEILTIDYFESIYYYQMPRFRYRDRAVRNESDKDSNIIGFRIIKKGI